MKKIINLIDRSLFFLEISLLSFSLASVVLLSLYQIVIRYAFDSGLPWIDVFVRYLMFSFCLFGCSLGFRYDRFIGLEILNNFLNDFYKKICQILVYIVTLLVLAFFVFYSWEYSKQETKAYILPLGFTLMFARILIRLYKLIFDPQAHVRQMEEF